MTRAPLVEEHGDDKGVAQMVGPLDCRGHYEVIFERNVRSCVYVATIGSPGAVGESAPGLISTAGRNGARNGVFLDTRNSSGGHASRGFHLVVNCPS